MISTRRTGTTAALMIVVLSVASGCGPIGGDGAATQTLVTSVVDGLNNPTSILIATDGSLIVAESAAGRIIAVDPEGNVSTLIEDFALGTYTPFDIGPLALTTAADGSLIVGEGGNRAGREQVSFYSTDGVQAADPLIPVAGNDFFDVVVEPSSGNLYIAGTGSNRIYLATPAETGGFGEPTDFVTDTTADPIRAQAPSALAFDAEGRLLVGFADEAGGKIVALNTGPDAESVFIEELVSDEAPITSIAIRPSDNAVAYAEMEGAGSGNVKIIDADGVESTYAGGLAGPTDIAFDADDFLYVTLLGETPNSDTGQLITVEIVEITTNGADEDAGSDPS